MEFHYRFRSHIFDGHQQAALQPAFPYDVVGIVAVVGRR
jgi:hypothetical protein